MRPDHASFPVLVLADDLSGAAEIAALGQRLGYRPRLRLFPAGAAEPVQDLLVVDTGSRAVGPAENRQRLAHYLPLLRRWQASGQVFVKIDSVLRGHILATAVWLQAELPTERLWLLPANPSRGRTLVAGRYQIAGVPLHQTDFARDPAFPRQTDAVPGLLGQVTLPPWLQVPEQGSLAELRVACQAMQPGDLCLGAADAFEAWLRQQGAQVATRQTPWPSPPPYSLVIHGSTAPDEAVRRQITAAGIVPASLALSDPALEAHLLDGLRQQGVAYCHSGLPLQPGPSARQAIQTRLAQLAQRVVAALAPAPLHLFLTGGETALTFMQALDFRAFEVLGEISPGLVTLRPEGAVHWVTTKPGSYPWEARHFHPRLAAHFS